jgi:hypothetical protein
MVSKFLVHAKDDHVGEATYDTKKGKKWGLIENLYLIQI